MPIDKNGRKYIIVGMDNDNIPDIFKYQLNGKTANENYQDILKQRRLKAQQEREKKQRELEIEKELEKEIETKLSSLLERKLDELLKGF